MDANFYELMHAGKSTERCPITDLNMSCQLRAIGNRGVATHHAIMRDMHIRHQPVIVADTGHALILHGATIETAVFANRIPITDFKLRRLALIFFILIRFT